MEQANEKACLLWLLAGLVTGFLWVFSRKESR
jgi:hypothetical protein